MPMSMHSNLTSSEMSVGLQDSVDTCHTLNGSTSVLQSTCAHLAASIVDDKGRVLYEWLIQVLVPAVDAIGVLKIHLHSQPPCPVSFITMHSGSWHRFHARLTYAHVAAAAAAHAAVCMRAGGRTRCIMLGSEVRR